MVNYTLNITFSNNTDLTNFRTYFGAVTVVKDAPSTSTGTSSQTAWLNFAPWEYTSVSWDDSYYIYASQQPIVSGQVISMTSHTDDVAQLGVLYDMNANGSIGLDDGKNNFPAPVKGAYNAGNLVVNQPGQVTMGLAQLAQITPGSGVQPQPSPTCASPVLYNTTINWTPDTTVYLYAQKSVKQGSIVIVTSVNACQIQFSTKQTVRTVLWNSSLNIFQADDNIKPGVMALPRLESPVPTKQALFASPARCTTSSAYSSPYKASPSKASWIRLTASAPNHPNKADFTSRLTKFVAKCAPLQAALKAQGISWKLESGNSLLVSESPDKFTELFRNFWKQAEKTKTISIVVRPSNGSYAGSAVTA